MSQKLKQAKRGLSQKDLPAKLKKSVHHNYVALDLADQGIVQKDLPSIFGGVPKVPVKAVAVQVHARTLVTICCVYLPPHDVISQHDLDTLVNQLPAPFILLVDFNGPTTLWGSDVTKSRGRQIERLISNNCLCLLNKDEKAYFHEPTRTFHSLYLAICSRKLLTLLNLTVESDLCNSDHFPIIVSYADRFNILHGIYSIGQTGFSCQGSNMNLIERQLQKAVNKLAAWQNNNGHTISPEKSRCVHFCRERNLHLDPVIHIQNVAIPVVNDIRFLGVIIDRKLTFLLYILYLWKKCERYLNILKVLSKTSWGADRTSLLRIYQTLILSHIDYGRMARIVLLF
ncbi:hypothetical protein AVEN_203703-1 [Araneus ventricosus]|uniref:Endonuclease/exonuclease/phosphatase domain-containing protein n=1 Tax=Araneus ventricosus TaxID=182803 RepID=A0A4Y2EYQ8_ARAVE|nr:hypothetical protein AVEN_203703-1 [Araneus ventricosus]